MTEIKKYQAPELQECVQLSGARKQHTCKKKELVWNVIYHDFNKKQIGIFNVFNHIGFEDDVRKHFKKCATKEDFAEQLRRSLFYFFSGKAEWEIVIQPWCGGKSTPDKKVDVYWQIMNNWDIFLDYVWSARPHQGKKVVDRCGVGNGRSRKGL